MRLCAEVDELARNCLFGRTSCQVCRLRNFLLFDITMALAALVAGKGGDQVL